MLLKHRAACWLLAIHTVLLANCAVKNSFTWTEVGLLPSGVINWRYGTFDVYRVSPPLVRMWATIPVLAFDPDIPFHRASTDPRVRSEWDLARSMISLNGERSYLWLTLARMMCLPFILLGAWVTYRWSSELFGQTAGVGALVIWTFCPMLIGYGCLMSGDAQATAMGIVAMYTFRSWLKQPTWRVALLLGLSMGIAVLTKLTWLILFVMLPVLWFTVRMGEIDYSQPHGILRAFRRQTAQGALSVAICLYVINLAYGFDGTFKRLGEYRFISKSLTDSANWSEFEFSDNRFSDSWIGKFPVPFPEDMVIGMDLQKWDFDKERWSYLNGEWRTHGWWYYYIYAVLIKTPIGFIALLAISFMSGCIHHRGQICSREFCLLSIPPLAIIVLASAETGLNRHMRYVLPAYPFVIIITSRVFLAFEQHDIPLRRLLTILVVWATTSSLWIYPHSHAYFNESVGGPLQGRKHLNASNLDWGQDFKYLRSWCQEYPESTPRWIRSYLHLVDLSQMGIESQGKVPEMSRKTAVQPGWYIIDSENLLNREEKWRHLAEMTPYARVGYSFHIYRLFDGQTQASEIGVTD